MNLTRRTDVQPGNHLGRLTLPVLTLGRRALRGRWHVSGSTRPENA